MLVNLNVRFNEDGCKRNALSVVGSSNCRVCRQLICLTLVFAHNSLKSLNFKAGLSNRSASAAYFRRQLVEPTSEMSIGVPRLKAGFHIFVE